MESLISTALAHAQREEALPLSLLEAVGEPDPPSAADALHRLTLRSEMRSGRSSWLPALLLTAQPGRGALRFLKLLDGLRDECGHRFDPLEAPTLPLLLGASEHLGRLVSEHPHLALELGGDPPAPPKRYEPMEGADWSQIREAKLRGLLRSAARELIGCPIQDIFTELSDLMERCLVRAVERATLEADTPVDMSWLALGSFGARTLSLSSRLDLLVVAPDDEAEAGRRGAQDGRLRLLQAFRVGVEKDEAGGPILDIGLGLPDCGGLDDPVRGPNALAGWCRRAIVDRPDAMAICTRLISARPVLDPTGAGEAIVERISGILYGLQGMPTDDGTAWAQDADEPAVHGRFDVRNGCGGIRHVEYFVYGLAMRHGAREPSLRGGDICDVIQALARSGLLDEYDARSLLDAYGWLRRAEHFLQLADEGASTLFPETREAQVGLARSMGYREVDAESAHRRLLRDRAAVRAQVMALGSDPAKRRAQDLRV